MKNNLLLFILLLSTLISCQQTIEKKVHFVGEAQGTYYAITYFDHQEHNWQIQVDSILAAFDQSVSVYQPNSIVSKVNRNEEVQLDDWFIGNFELSQTIAEETNGAFDITIGPLANVWGFGTFEKPDSVNVAKIDSAKKLIGYHRVYIENNSLIKENQQMQLNFNAVAQGYAVDVLAQFFISKGIHSFLIDIGGEIYAKSNKPNGDSWKIGIEIPEEGNEERFYNHIIQVKDEAVATSGNYRKFYELDGVKYAHSLNPKTGYPVQHSLLSTTVIAPTAAQADAYATAFMVMGVESTLSWASKHPEIKVYLMFDEDGELKTAMSENFQAYLEGENH